MDIEEPAETVESLQAQLAIIRAVKKQAQERLNLPSRCN